MIMTRPPVCLTIAGSDPSGGAGIQGDLKTFAAHGVYGMAVITALTAQSTQTVSGVVAVEPAFVTEQLERIYDDVPSNFVKTGMLLNHSIIETVVEFFQTRSSVSIIVDPVMISSSGAELLRPDAVRSYVDKMFPLALLVTPNNLETQHLAKLNVGSVDQAVKASDILREMGAKSVLIKGGDTKFVESENRIFDVLNFEGDVHVFERDLIGARNTHGTGCALASAICSNVAQGVSLPEAVDLAGKYVGEAIRNAYATGKGSGSINHLWNVNSGQLHR